MNMHKFGLIALAGVMSLGFTGCFEDDSGTNSSLIDPKGKDNPDNPNNPNNPDDPEPANPNIKPNGIDYTDSKSYREYTADLTVGSVKHLVVRIGNQLWMGENLDDGTVGWCYNDDEDYCAVYGALYTWSEAMDIDSTYNYKDASLKVKSKHQGICPDGWRLPTETDFEKMKDYIYYDFDHDDIALDAGYSKEDDVSAIQLKATNFNADDVQLWSTKEGVPGVDVYGFYAVGTGIGHPRWGTDDYGYDVIVDYDFERLTEITCFWTATQDGEESARSYCLTHNGYYMYNDYWAKDKRNAVRCMKDY